MIPKSMETAGVEPASCNIYIQLLHAYPVLKLGQRPGTGAFSRPVFPLVSPFTQEHWSGLSTEYDVFFEAPEERTSKDASRY